MPDFSESHDFMNNSPMLRSHCAARALFDPANEQHLESFKTFLATGNWGSIQFLCEAPYTDVPMTVLMKFAMYKQGVQRESEGDRRARFAAMPLVSPVGSESSADRKARLSETNKKLMALV